jgi:hypothetical protein
MGKEDLYLLRLQREREKIRVSQEKINRVLAEQKQDRRKFETRRKVLLGVILQEMIVEGRISEKLFNEFLEKSLNERDRSVFDGYLDKFLPKQP